MSPSWVSVRNTKEDANKEVNKEVNKDVNIDINIDIDINNKIIIITRCILFVPSFCVYESYKRDSFLYLNTAET